MGYRDYDYSPANNTGGREGQRCQRCRISFSLFFFRILSFTASCCHRGHTFSRSPNPHSAALISKGYGAGMANGKGGRGGTTKGETI